MMHFDIDTTNPSVTVGKAKFFGADALVLEKVLALTGKVEAMADAIGELNKAMATMRDEMVTQSELLDVISVTINACVSDDEDTDVAFDEGELAGCDFGALRTIEVEDDDEEEVSVLRKRVSDLEDKVFNLGGLAARVDELAAKVDRRDAGLLYRSDKEFKPLPDVVKCKCRKPIDEGEQARRDAGRSKGWDF